MAQFPWMTSLLWTWTATFLEDIDIAVDDSCRLPWTVPRDAYQDLPDDVFDTLMDCPNHYHGCSDTLVSCNSPDTFVVTCSCASNCRAYGDCCWNVELPEHAEADTPHSSCVEVETHLEPHTSLKMVVGCPQTWPENDVRKRCEESESFDEVFYRIPVTGSHHITYRNGFCALCNNDMMGSVFWNTTRHKEGKGSVVHIPDEVFTHPALHLRSCTENHLRETCPQNVPEDVARKCKMYYAPVEDRSGMAFKNIYCAMCNRANESTLSCREKRYETTRAFRRPEPPSLAAIFRPVKRTPTCLAEYDGRCYISLKADFKAVHEFRNLYGSLTLHPRSHEDEDELSKSYDVQHYLTLICLSLSIGCLLLKILVFCVYRTSRSFSSKCTLSLAFTLMLTHILFLLINCIDLPDIGCVVGGVLFHYGFLSTFCWTCTLSYDICRSLTAVKLSSTRDSKLAAYGLFAWGLPLVITAAALTVDRTMPGTALSPSYGDPICWIGTFWSLVLYYLIPVAVLLLLCFFFYIRSVSYIRRTSSAAGSAPGELRPSAAEEVRSIKQRNHAVLFVRLAVIMCSPWVGALVGTFVVSKVVDSIVNVLLGLQGVYLFFGFKDYRYILSSMQKRGISVSPHKASRSSQEQLTP